MTRARMNINRWIALLLLALLPPSAHAAEKKYPVDAIPENMRKDVNAVVRENFLLFKIIAKNRAVQVERFVVTIFNAKGNHFAMRDFGYDKLTRITELKAHVYDAGGQLIKKLKSSDFVDRSSYDGFSLYSDNRLKSIDVSQGSFPYTVEYEAETDYKYLYSVPDLELLPTENVAVEHITYQVSYPKSLAPRFKLVNLEKNPLQQSLPENSESVTWEFQNLLPLKTEPAGPNWRRIAPRILAGPSMFEYDGYTGNMDTWESYGKWQLQLNEGRDVLSETTKRTVKELTKNGTTEDRVKALYNYLQNKTRYVSIQDGIGGLQPFPAEVVEQNGYGDCKALSNFMISLLREASIPAYYTKIRAGTNEDEIELDFPSHQTNHIIVAVPNQADTIWLECTSQTNPFGYLGRFTGGRTAILVSENGGKLVKTPKYGVDVNRQIRTAEVVLDISGDATATVRTVYSGLQYENGNLDAYLSLSGEDQKKWLQKNTEIPSFDIMAFSFQNRKEKIPSAVVKATLSLKRFASVSGRRVFLTPNLMNRSTYVPEKVENRKTAVVRKFAYVDVDTILYRFPENLYPEFLPPPAQFKSRFGEYESTYTMDAGQLKYVRRIKMLEGEFPSSSYQEMIEFFKNVNKADHVKIVFLNRT